jgi:multidrug efflux pump subunit AcrA (membrane-fusion protein)
MTWSGGGLRICLIQWLNTLVSVATAAGTNDIRAAAALRTPRTSRTLLFTFLALLAAFLIWAHFAVLDEVKRGNGRVVPSQQTQVVQSLEGGIVGAILVIASSMPKRTSAVPLFMMRTAGRTRAKSWAELRLV